MQRSICHSEQVCIPHTANRLIDMHATYKTPRFALNGPNQEKPVFSLANVRTTCHLPILPMSEPLMFGLFHTE